MNDDREHRESLFRRRFSTGLDVSGSATVMASLAAGIVFLIIELASGYLLGFRPPLAPADVFLISAAGDAPVRDLGFDAGPLLMASFFHLFLALLFGFILTFIIYRWKSGVATAVGALFGIILLLIFTRTFGSFDEVVSSRGIIMAIAYLTYGIATAVLYKRYEQR